MHSPYDILKSKFIEFNLNSIITVYYQNHIVRRFITYLKRLKILKNISSLNFRG